MYYGSPKRKETPKTPLTQILITLPYQVGFNPLYITATKRITLHRFNPLKIQE
jgi:hypothetical protein